MDGGTRRHRGTSRRSVRFALDEPLEGGPKEALSKPQTAVSALADSSVKNNGARRRSKAVDLSEENSPAQKSMNKISAIDDSEHGQLLSARRRRFTDGTAATSSTRLSLPRSGGKAADAEVRLPPIHKTSDSNPRRRSALLAPSARLHESHHDGFRYDVNVACGACGSIAYITVAINALQARSCSMGSAAAPRVIRPSISCSFQTASSLPSTIGVRSSACESSCAIRAVSASTSLP